MPDKELEAKVLAFYVKLKTEFKGPVHKMVMDPVLKEYEEYFQIKLVKK
jgi:hypothetical protein